MKRYGRAVCLRKLATNASRSSASLLPDLQIAAPVAGLVPEAWVIVGIAAFFLIVQMLLPSAYFYSLTGRRRTPSKPSTTVYRVHWSN